MAYQESLEADQAKDVARRIEEQEQQEKELELERQRVEEEDKQREDLARKEVRGELYKLGDHYWPLCQCWKNLSLFVSAKKLLTWYKFNLDRFVCEKCSDREYFEMSVLLSGGTGHTI